MGVTRRSLATSVLAMAGLVLAACGGGGSASGGAGQYEREGDFAKGNVNAPVTMIEYASTSCPHCADFHENVMPSIEPYIDGGQLRLVFREMLTGDPRLARAGFMLARCVPENRYFDAIDLLFQQQNAIFQAGSRPNGIRDEFWAIAQAVGLSSDRFETCMASRELSDAVTAAHERAGDDGIDGTPRFIINGHMLDTGRQEGQVVYYWNDAPLVIDGEAVPALQDAETFTRILDHFIAQSEAGGE